MKRNENKNWKQRTRKISYQRKFFKIKLYKNGKYYHIGGNDADNIKTKLQNAKHKKFS